MKEQDIKKTVKENYGKVAKQSGSCCGSSCCGQTSGPLISEYTSRPNEASKMVGYSDEEMQSVPPGSNLGLGCGNPTALASIREGETVLDLGSGAGFDCFLAAKKVGQMGKVIGVDMTPEMIEKARANAAKAGYKNVEFRHGEIENLPVDDSTIDLIISNCVINLVPDKKKAFQEAFRVLKPGGRLMVSDMVLLKEPPKAVRESVEAYVGCIAGAELKNKYLEAIKSAGFRDVSVVSESILTLDYLANDPIGQAVLEHVKVSGIQPEEANGLASSIKVRGVKPA
jgi:SAM-dependent methyltransferase